MWSKSIGFSPTKYPPINNCRSRLTGGFLLPLEISGSILCSLYCKDILSGKRPRKDQIVALANGYEEMCKVIERHLATINKQERRIKFWKARSRK